MLLLLLADCCGYAGDLAGLRVEILGSGVGEGFTLFLGVVGFYLLVEFFHQNNLVIS